MRHARSRTKKEKELCELCPSSSLQRTAKIYTRTGKIEAKHGFQGITMVRRNRGIKGLATGTYQRETPDSFEDGRDGVEELLILVGFYEHEVLY